MPILIDKTVARNSRLLVWKVTEPLEFLLTGIKLNDRSKSRFEAMKSEAHQCTFLSVRQLLSAAGYTDFDLFYDAFGKPNLRNGKHISISHSHHFAAIIISDIIVGIDLEWAREKIIRIAKKFAVTEMPFLETQPEHNLIHMLTVIWGVKESIFKIRNEPGISFKDHLSVLPFELRQKYATGKLHFGSVNVNFDVHFEIIEEFVLVYAFPSN
ncbi:MAG TPA: 4'-phosphopantetheinyl transferase superfamily protein [Flavobacterium sp.]|jgi:phosphopantetheinyl transferase